MGSRPPPTQLQKSNVGKKKSKTHKIVPVAIQVGFL